MLFRSQITRASNFARKQDVILVVLGSNDARDLARDNKTCRPWQYVNNICKAMQNASAKTVFILPLPSPCYVRNNWCLNPPCVHELLVTRRMQSLHRHIRKQMRRYPWVQLTDCSTLLLNKVKNAVSRRNFQAQTIHLTASRVKEFTDDLEDMILNKLNE